MRNNKPKSTLTSDEWAGGSEDSCSERGLRLVSANIDKRPLTPPWLSSCAPPVTGPSQEPASLYRQFSQQTLTARPPPRMVNKGER